jgi:hypothetical protein
VLHSKKDLAIRTKRVRFTHRSKCSTSASLMPEGKIAVAQANLRLEERTSEDKTNALDTALSQVERAFGKGLIIHGKNASTGLTMLETIEPDAKLFALPVPSVDSINTGGMERTLKLTVRPPSERDPRALPSG